MQNASQRCKTAWKFCLLCWLLSEKLFGFETWNVVIINVQRGQLIVLKFHVSNPTSFSERAGVSLAFLDLWTQNTYIPRAWEYLSIQIHPIQKIDSVHTLSKN